MEGVFSLANQIGDRFLNLEKYQEYKTLYDKIKTNPETLAKLKKYRNLKMDNYVNYTINDDKNKELEIEINKIYSDLAVEEDIRMFLDIEIELLRLLSDIYKIIGDKCFLFIDVD